MSGPAFKTIAIIGFGEAGGILGAELAKKGPTLRTYDILLGDAGARDEMLKKTASARVEAAASHAAAARGADLVISAVTAASSVDVAKAVAPHLARGQIYLDINSVSPEAKRASARLVEGAGADYVEAAVMAAVPPKRLKVPMILGGRRAKEVAAALNAMGFDTEAVADTIGVASAIKMCRSVMIKGLEALVIESYSTARAYGVEDHVLPTLQETFPSIDWSEQGAYFFSRVVQHGQRRAEEMREAANTVREAGFEPLMTAAIADKQQWVADQARAGVFRELPKGARWQDYADRLLAGRDLA